jgi:hypothetical protein
LKRVQSSEPLHTKITLILLLLRQRVCMATTSRDPYKNRAALWKIFSSNKSALANRKKGFYTSRLPKNEEIVSIFVFSGSEL